MAYSSSDDATNKNKIRLYGCIEYATSVNCDPMHNNLSGFQYGATSEKIHELTSGQPFFVEGKYGKGLEMIAPYREAVHFPP